ncbi:MAG: hypothetical protein ACTSPR_01465 [Candidatus Thorarchaeota archaeon]
MNKISSALYAPYAANHPQESLHPDSFAFPGGSDHDRRTIMVNPAQTRRALFKFTFFLIRFNGFALAG